MVLQEVQSAAEIVPYIVVTAIGIAALGVGIYLDHRSHRLRASQAKPKKWFGHDPDRTQPLH